MIKIKNLHARVEEKEILKGINLEIKPGEVHAIMGPNGSGKSTLSNVIAGREDYEVTGGSIDFEGADLLDLDPVRYGFPNQAENVIMRIESGSTKP